MESRWSDTDARAAVERHAALGVAEDLALRVYTTRLLGGDPSLVLHGGGNTSLKTRATDMTGEEWEVLCVKGSGWDMATIEAAGLPAVKLAPLRKARGFDALSDEDMVKLQRANLLDPSAPNPSVETLLHAFLPHRYVDHTHSTAVLALSDQPDGQDICREVFGGRFGIVDYVAPGLDLARAAAEVYEADPEVEGLVLDKHGLFTFAGDARTSYERTIGRRAWPRRGSRAAAAGPSSPPPRFRPGRPPSPTWRRSCAARRPGRWAAAATAASCWTAARTRAWTPSWTAPGSRTTPCAASARRTWSSA